MKVAAYLLVLLLSFGVGVPAILADEPGRSAARACQACPDGGSTEPSSHDCQASGGYVVGPAQCDDGGCAAWWTCVCCAWDY